MKAPKYWNPKWVINTYQLKKLSEKNVICVSQSVIEPPDFVCFEKTRKQKKRVNLLNISPNIANKKQKFPIKVYIFELADLSASQWKKEKRKKHTYREQTLVSLEVR